MDQNVQPRARRALSLGDRRREVLQELRECIDLQGERSWVIVINLDRFGLINVGVGFEVADHLLDCYKTCIEFVLPNGGTCWHLHADEFLVHIKAAGQEIGRITERIHQAVNDLRVASVNANLALTCSIGTVASAENDFPAQEYVRQATAAMMQAKRDGGNGTVVFESSILMSANRKLQLECDLRHALSSGQLEVYLQSQFDTHECVIGAECLLRWNHPERGTISPGEFLPLAEESDLIVDIGRWVIDQACTIQARLGSAGSDMRISINISPRQFMKANFCDSLMHAVKFHGADASKLVLEVTEGLVLRGLAEVRKRMLFLVSKGFVLSLDDFGTGYSSFSYLKSLPVQEMKIPRSFVAQEASDENSVMQAMMLMARSMKLEVVAEGVETPEELKRLRRLGGDQLIFQGFLFARPVPAEHWMAQFISRSTIPA
jgi:diguanylate cyclase (GGDEF)-like protein